MTKHVCGICGYSLDDSEYEGCLSASLTMHMQNAHLPSVTYTNIPEKDEVVYKLLVPSEHFVPLDPEIVALLAFEKLRERKNR